MTNNSVPFSVLDLAPIPEGSSAKEAFSHSLDLARLAEKRGYHRYWLAEHHNMTGIASAATSVLIGYLAASTTTLHLGSGGVMLPNHSPLVIAEQFGTLNTLYPGRIDLGLGRAPDMLFQALHLYRTQFKPSARLEKPYAMDYCRRQQSRRGVSVYLHAAGVCEATPWRDRPTAAAD